MDLCRASAVTLFYYCMFFSHHLITPVNGTHAPAPDFLGDVAVNCGYPSNATALDGRDWIAEAQRLEPEGKSTRSMIENRAFSADPIPYVTARISATQFSYTFQVNPGQKFVRLHFYPSSYRGYEMSEDVFTVKAGPFTLLKSFSASLAADAMGVKYLVKEFGLNVEANRSLNLTFSPSESRKRKTYAFVNGIEIISMPTGLYYTPDHDLGAPIVGLINKFYYIDNSTALEMVQRLNIGGSSISPVEDFGLFRRWTDDANYLLESKLPPVNRLMRGIKYTGIPVYTAPLKIYQTSWKTRKDTRGDEMHSFTWKIPVDVGFGYLVRLHFCDFELEMTGDGQREFSLLINNLVAENKVTRLSGGTGVPIFRDYMVIVKGDKAAGKCDLLIALQSSDGSAIGLLRGLEIFKLINPDNSLGSPNPVIMKHVSTSWNLKIQNLLLAFGKKNASVTGITILLILLNVTVFKLKQIWGETCQEVKDTRPAFSGPSCRRFSLAEIKSATQNFSDAFLTGKGGFGNVYKGFISGGSETVAVKRLKSNSKQGAQEFWAEIETLSQIRHIHLVSLIGYCNENKEMILVYEYMPSGTLADNLYKIGRNGKECTPLAWEQRLRICIGAARGLDYLHTGIKYRVIHRDVKDSNILLDEDLVAKISDFGLSKLGTVSESLGIVSTKVKGTFGYLDPDYFMTHKPTRKTDVYAFGVVMLVVLCGRPAVDLREHQSLLFLFREAMSKGDIGDIIDPSLQGKVLSESLKEFIKSVENCLHPEPKKRPTMSQLVTSLEYALELQQSKMSSKSEEAAKNRIMRPSLGIALSHQKLSSRNVSWDESQTPRSEGEILRSSNLKNFTFAELRAATRNFRPDNVLGVGDYSTVFKGWIDKQSLAASKPGIGMMVAVKRLNREGGQGRKELLANLNYLRQLHHPNLVKLIGYCLEDDHRLLVYEFMPNGSLENYLFRSNSNFQPLSWSLRIKIALGAARGLAFLHGAETKVICRDFKTSNILLDSNYNAKLSDFGLAQDGPTVDKSYIPTKVMATYEYRAPEYLFTGHLTAKSNVYSCGVVLLEILTGKRALDMNRPTGERNLVEWAKPYLSNKRGVFRVLDARLEGQYSLDRALKLANLAFQCLSMKPKLRPTMDEVVTALEQLHGSKGMTNSEKKDSHPN